MIFRLGNVFHLWYFTYLCKREVKWTLLAWKVKCNIAIRYMSKKTNGILFL